MTLAMSITIYLKMVLLFSKASVNIFVKPFLNYRNLEHVSQSVGNGRLMMNKTL